MSFFKRLFGMEPQMVQENVYTPSKFALKAATSSHTPYTPLSCKVEKPLHILMLCSEQSDLKMKNGKVFSTGNHPVEMLVPMLHFKDAGMDVDIVTLNGSPVKIEMWAFPNKEEKVVNLYHDMKDQFEHPHSLKQLLSNQEENLKKYDALFIPGGHGALLELPESKEVAALIHYFYKQDLYVMSICHGPAALLATAKLEEGFLYEGYKMAAFPDSMDEFTPKIGYMPGHLTWHFNEELEKYGSSIINQKADETCFVDRKLISGASPKAADQFGVLCVETLLKGEETKQC